MGHGVKIPGNEEGEPELGVGRQVSAVADAEKVDECISPGRKALVEVRKLRTLCVKHGRKTYPADVLMPIFAPEKADCECFADRIELVRPILFYR